MEAQASPLNDILRRGAVIPVLVIHEAANAVPLGRALVEAGVTVLEVTLRTEAALQAIARLVGEVPGAVVGAGTVTTPETLAAAARAGAAFAVSPGLTPALVDAAKDNALPLLPGVMTPSEAMRAREAGFTRLKLFPAHQAGGVGMLQALAGPLPELMFCPTGGVSPDNAPEYLAQPNVVCVGSSWVAPAGLVTARDWVEIGRRARAAAALSVR